MTEHQLRVKLSKFGNIQVMKAGLVFSLFITGTKLANATTVFDIQKSVTDFCGDKYPNIEAFRNDDTFFFMVLKPAGV